MARLATATQIEELRDGFRDLLLEVTGDFTDGGATQGEGFFTEMDTQVFARVRPVLEHEVDAGHFRTVHASAASKMSVQMLSTTFKGAPKLNRSDFKVDYAFGASASNLQLYEVVCSPLVELAKGGGTATLLAYGQTGSGKTFTISGLLGMAAEDLFVNSANLRQSVSVLEILGNNVTDLLSQEDECTVQVLEDRFGSVQFSGCHKFPVGDEGELKAHILRALQSRRTEATQKNDTSSRSHMIIRISIENLSLPEAEEGVLSLVDLAGSESAGDKTKHSAERMKESKLINTSLMTLKDCMRGRSLVLQQKNHVHIPYRASKLTHALRDCFELAVRRPIKTAIIACVSPLETACYHSSNTLRYAAGICVAPGQVVLEVDRKDPYNWDRATCCRFIADAGRGQARAEDILPEGTGKTLVKLPEHEFLLRAMRAGTMPEKQAKEMYIKLWKRVVDARTRFKTKIKDVTAKPTREEEVVEAINTGTY